MENSPYFESITAERAMLVSEEDWLAGNTLISIETMADVEYGQDTLAIYVKEHPQQFLTYLKFLTEEDRDMMLSSCLLGIPQIQLGTAMQRTQTVCSHRLRLAAKKLGFYTLMGGHPSREQMEAIENRVEYERAKDDDYNDVSIALIADLNRELGSFTAVGKKVNMRRQDVRRGISAASKAMIDSADGAISGFGAYLLEMVDCKDPNGRGKSKPAARRESRLHFEDPECIGQFYVSVTDTGFKSLFQSKSNLYHENHD